MIVACPSCTLPFQVLDDQIAPLVQTACPSCGFKMILDFAAANDPSLREPGMGMASGWRDEASYRAAPSPSEPAAAKTPLAAPERPPAPATTAAEEPVSERETPAEGVPATPRPAAPQAAPAQSPTAERARAPEEQRPAPASAPVQLQPPAAAAAAPSQPPLRRESTPSPVEVARIPPHTPPMTQPAIAAAAAPAATRPPSPADLSPPYAQIARPSGPGPVAAPPFTHTAGAQQGVAVDAEDDDDLSSGRRRGGRVLLFVVLGVLVVAATLVGVAFAMTGDPNPIPYIQSLLAR